jgi:hypothetical protein
MPDWGTVIPCASDGGGGGAQVAQLGTDWRGR